jgi:DNA invertase Pin-like site-specific DNA recombinase
MLIGYARVSTQDQTLNLQKDALEKIGCKKIFTDTASGAKAERKGLDEALNYVREGDTLVVWRLDRLGRSLKHLIETITALDNRKIGFKSITCSDPITSGRGPDNIAHFGTTIADNIGLLDPHYTANGPTLNDNSPITSAQTHTPR